jgi:hypothetical protein
MNLLLLTIRTWDSLSEHSDSSKSKLNILKNMAPIFMLFFLFFTYQILIDMISYHTR